MRRLRGADTCVRSRVLEFKNRREAVRVAETAKRGPRFHGAFWGAHESEGSLAGPPVGTLGAALPDRICLSAPSQRLYYLLKRVGNA